MSNSATPTANPAATTGSGAVPVPQLTIQTASLWDSGDRAIFSGTGGPFGYDPFFGQFAGVVSSAGLDSQPFADQLWNVGAGDQVVFVVAVQNRSDSASAYSVTLGGTIPTGFVIPDGGDGISVTDGAGNVLDFTGDLFSAGGLQIQDPLAPYDPDSGANIALITYTLQASATLPTPSASLSSSAQITSYEGVSGGPDLSGTVAPATLSAATPLATQGITLSVSPDQTISSLPSGQEASFDVAVALAPGEAENLTLQELTPHQGNSWLQIVIEQVLTVGPDVTLPVVPTVNANGSISFGDVTATEDVNNGTGADIIVRVTVIGAGTAAGQGVLQSTVSAADPNTAGATWSQTASNAIPLQAPDVAPTIAGASADQYATNTMQVHPFAGLLLTDPDLGQTETLTIHRSNALLGSLAGTGLTYSSTTGNYVLQGSIATVQQDAQTLVWTSNSGSTGTEQLNLTLSDGAGGVATNSTTSIDITAAAAAAAGIQHFPLSSTGDVLTSTADGSRTVAQIETYAGPVNYLQYQFIYDGTDPLAMVAQTPNTFIKCVAGEAAIQLLSGQNVVDAGPGSNFLIGGTGQATFYLDGRPAGETWDTIVGFHPGDIVTLWGFQSGVSSYWWDDNAGATGYIGRTLRADLTGSGHIEESITFAGKTATTTDTYAITTGTISGTPYLTIFG